MPQDVTSISSILLPNAVKPINERVNLSATTDITPKRLIEPVAIFAGAAGALRSAARRRHIGRIARASKPRIVTKPTFHELCGPMHPYVGIYHTQKDEMSRGSLGKIFRAEGDGGLLWPLEWCSKANRLGRSGYVIQVVCRALQGFWHQVY